MDDLAGGECGCQDGRYDGRAVAGRTGNFFCGWKIPDPLSHCSLYLPYIIDPHPTIPMILKKRSRRCVRCSLPAATLKQSCTVQHAQPCESETPNSSPSSLSFSRLLLPVSRLSIYALTVLGHYLDPHFLPRRRPSSPESLTKSRFRVDASWAAPSHITNLFVSLISQRKPSAQIGQVDERTNERASLLLR